MKITVKATQIKLPDSDLRGLVSVSFGKDILIRSITLRKGKDDNLFVSFPSIKCGNSYKEVCNPINKEFRQKLTDAIMESYHSKESVEFEDGKSGELVMVAYPTASDGKKVGEAKIYINDNFVISGISIFKGDSGKMYPVLPAYKKREFKESGDPIYESFCTIRKGIEAVVKKAIVNEYLATLKESQEGRISIKSKMNENKEKVSKAESKAACRNELVK